MGLTGLLRGGSVGGSESAAQTFTAGLTGGVDQVDLALGQLGPGNSVGVTVEIWTVSSTGAPGAKLGQSATILPNAIPGGLAFVSALFSPPIPVTAGVQYAIVVYTGGADQYQWGAAAPNPYVGGQLFQTVSSPPNMFEANPDFDAAFKTYVDVAGPTGPTSKAQCKNGGWRDFGDTFKNQGQCVTLFDDDPE